jgi:hypothetical protein
MNHNNRAINRAFAYRGDRSEQAMEIQLPPRAEMLTDVRRRLDAA